MIPLSISSPKHIQIHTTLRAVQKNLETLRKKNGYNSCILRLTSGRHSSYIAYVVLKCQRNWWRWITGHCGNVAHFNLSIQYNEVQNMYKCVSQGCGPLFVSFNIYIYINKNRDKRKQSTPNGIQANFGKKIKLYCMVMIKILENL